MSVLAPSLFIVFAKLPQMFTILVTLKILMGTSLSSLDLEFEIEIGFSSMNHQKVTFYCILTSFPSFFFTKGREKKKRDANNKNNVVHKVARFVSSFNFHIHFKIILIAHNLISIKLTQIKNNVYKKDHYFENFRISISPTLFRSSVRTCGVLAWHDCLSV